MPVFLFTDIEGSTKLWEKHRQAMPEVLQRHDTIMNETLAKFGGRVIDHMGDGVYAIFESGQPLHCVLEIQKLIAAEPWPSVQEIRIRMGLNGRQDTLEGQDFFRDGSDYFGPVVNHTARIMNTAWGGQILLTPEVLELAALPEGATLQDLGTHRLRSLEQPQNIIGLLHPELKIQKFPPLRSLADRPNNLPPANTQFIGRKQELDEIDQTLANKNCRLLTLNGPGGIGKTRLALAAAEMQLAAPSNGSGPFSQGIYFVPLASSTSAEHIIAAIANALAFSFYKSSDSTAQLIDFLYEKDILLILDNFEQLIGEADILRHLLVNTQKVKMLITSRERLNLKLEWVLEIDGMNYPETERRDREDPGQFTAVQLFLRGIHRVNPGNQITPEDIRSIAEIAQILGGNPLGIELASAWTRILSPAEIVQELGQNLDFLDSSLRDVPERHRSLRAVFEHSWNLLTPEEQAVLRKLSVFQGGFRREAAQEVAGGRLAILSSLMDKSLLRRGTYGRYTIHQTVKQYGSSKLAENPEELHQTRERHCIHYAEFIHHRRDRLRGRQQKQILGEVGAEIENIRTGWSWSLQQKTITAINNYLQGLYHFYWIRGWLEEGREAFARAISELETTIQRSGQSNNELQLLLGKLLARQGGFSYRLRRRQEADRLLRRSLDIFVRQRRRKDAAYSYCYLGAVAYLQKDYAKAYDRLHQSLAILRDVGGQLGTAIVLHHLGMVAYADEEYNQARQWHQESLAVAQKMGEPYSIAVSLNHLGMVAHAQAQYGEAQRLHGASLTIRQEIGDQWGISIALNGLGQVAFVQQSYEQAKTYFEESIRISREIGDRKQVALTLQKLSQVLDALGMAEQAETLLRESAAILTADGDLADIPMIVPQIKQQPDQ